MNARKPDHFLALLVIAALLVAAAGCGGQQPAQPQPSAQPQSSTTASQPAKPGPIVIGTTLPLTGPIADTAKWVKNGYEVWAEQVNKKGGLLGREVQLKVYDDEGKPDKGVQLLEKLITVDKVELILGGYPGSTAAAQAPVAEKYQFTYIGMGGHGPSFSQGYKYFFGAPPLMAEWFPLAFLDWLKHVRDTVPADQKPKTLAMINVNNIIGQGGRKATHEWLQKNMPDLKVVVDEVHETPLTSADALVAKVKQAKADVLMISNNLQDSALILRSLKAQGYQPKTVWAGIGPTVPEWSKELGPLGDYVGSGAGAHPAADGPGTKLLNDLSMAKFNLPANLYFMIGYNYGATLEAAVNGAKSLDNTKLRDWLKSNLVETPLGKYKFDERGLPEPVSYLIQVQNGKPELVWPKGPNTKEPVYPTPPWK